MSNPSLAQVHPSHNSPEQIRVISRRRPPWAWFDKRIITRYGRQLGPHGIAVYMALAVHVDGELQTCFPSYQTIAKQIGVSKPTVLKAIKLLLTLHLITKQAMQSPEGDPGPNLYVLLDIPATPIDLQATPPPDDLAPPELSTDQRGVGNDIDHPTQRPLPGVGNDVDPNKNLLERYVKNKNNSMVIHTNREQETQKPQPSSYGRRGYLPLTSQQLAERKAFLRQQAAELARQGESRSRDWPWPGRDATIAATPGGGPRAGGCEP
jgi:Helix-turn-helix domain